MATIEEIQQNPMLNLKIIHRYLTDEEISANKIEDLNDLITKWEIDEYLAQYEETLQQDPYFDYKLDPLDSAIYVNKDINLHNI